MNPAADSERFASAIGAALEVYGKGVSETALRLWWSSLKTYGIDEVLRGLTRHLQDPERGQWQPKPADVIWQIEAAKTAGWVSADEAWATALLAQDEAETVIWTEESAGAHAIARPILAAGDEVGARIAFREAYNRLVKAAAGEGRAPRQQVSLGHDSQRREQAVRQAVDRGLLTQERADKLLPAPQPEPGGFALLTGNVVAHPSAGEAIQRQLAALKEKLRSPQVVDQQIQETPEVQQKRAVAARFASSTNQGDPAGERHVGTK